MDLLNRSSRFKSQQITQKERVGRRVASSRALKVICFIFDQAGLIDWEDEPGGGGGGGGALGNSQ